MKMATSAESRYSWPNAIKIYWVTTQSLWPPPPGGRLPQTRLSISVSHPGELLLRTGFGFFGSNLNLNWNENPSLVRDSSVQMVIHPGTLTSVVTETRRVWAERTAQFGLAISLNRNQLAQCLLLIRPDCKITSETDVTFGVVSPNTRLPYPSSATGALPGPAAGHRCCDTYFPGPGLVPGPGPSSGPGPDARRAPPCCRVEPSSQLALSTEPSADPVPQTNAYLHSTPSPLIRNRSVRRCAQGWNGDQNMEARSEQIYLET